MNDNSITCIVGPMFARKTTELISRIRKAKDAYGDAAVLVLKHSMDDRYDSAKIVSHDNVTEPTVAIPQLRIAWGFLRLMPHIRSVFIDEGQFFDDLIEYVIKMRDSGRSITVAGLDKDFRRENFPNMSTLTRDYANTILKLTANCNYCGSKAPYTRKKREKVANEDADKTVVIGAAEIYEPVCAKCYVDKNSEL